MVRIEKLKKTDFTNEVNKEVYSEPIRPQMILKLVVLNAY